MESFDCRHCNTDEYMNYNWLQSCNAPHYWYHECHKCLYVLETASKFNGEQKLVVKPFVPSKTCQTY